MRAAFAIAVALLSGFGAFAFMRWLPFVTRGRMRSFDALLTRAGIEPNGWILDRLQAQAARRQVWGAVGAGVGYGITLIPESLLSSSLLDGASGGLGVVGLWFGWGVGSSASALFPVQRARGPVLVTRMQPHGMTEYLHRGEILIEVSLGVLGWLCAIVGALALTDAVEGSAIRHAAPSMLLVGGVVAGVATTTLFGQRRLVWLPGPAWWLVAIFGIAAAVPLGVTFLGRKQPTSLPVMHRLAVRSRAA